MKSYHATVEHIIGQEKHYFSFPPISANSFTMATAIFEKMALENPACGIVLNISIHRRHTEYITEN